MRFFNTQSSQVDGYVLAASYDLGGVVDSLAGLSVYGNYTRQDSTIDHGSSAPGAGDDLAGNRAPNAPETLSNFGVRYRHRTGLWARVGRNHTGDYYSDAANSKTPSADGVNGYVPEFTIWDASIGWNQNADGSGFSVAVGCTNLFDDDEWFRRNTTGIQPGAPRRFNVNVGYALNF
jgi:Fe(3+) dicitrate transport protein